MDGGRTSVIQRRNSKPMQCILSRNRNVKYEQINGCVVALHICGALRRTFHSNSVGRREGVGGGRGRDVDMSGGEICWQVFSQVEGPTSLSPASL